MQPADASQQALDSDLPPGETCVPALIPCHAKDLPTLPFCVEALRRHPQITEIRVICAEAIQSDVERLGVGFVDELSLLEPWFSADAPYAYNHWYYQMILKYSAAFLTDLGSDRFLIIDADTVLLHSFPLIDAQSGVVLHPKMTEHVLAYWTGMSILLGHEVSYEGAYTAHMMVFRASLVKAMFSEFARVRGRPPQEGLDVLREYLRTCDRVTHSFCDYETYGHFLREHFPSECRWAQRRQLNMLYVAPNPSSIARVRPYYDYCNFHWYRRPNRWTLSLAGASWLNLRIARDRISGALPLSESLPPAPARAGLQQARS